MTPKNPLSNAHMFDETPIGHHIKPAVPFLMTLGITDIRFDHVLGIESMLVERGSGRDRT
jgi:hypothetical protein